MKFSILFFFCFSTFPFASGQTNTRNDILKVTVDDYSLKLSGINKVMVTPSQLLILKKETLVIIDDKIFDSSSFKHLNIDSSYYRLIQLTKDSSSKSTYKEVYIYKSKH